MGKAILNQDAASNLTLQVGDVITIFSQADLRVPEEQQTKLIRLDGEFGSSGVYRVKPLYIIFVGFWLLTDALYPHLAKVEAGVRAHRMLFAALALLAAGASAIAALIALLAPRLLTLIYGSTLGATELFRVLLIALPIDFCFSLLWTVMISRGFDKPVLYSVGVAAGVNIVLNLVFIPRYQANAAAWATVASYALLFSLLLGFVLRNKVLLVAPADVGSPTSAVLV